MNKSRRENIQQFITEIKELQGKINNLLADIDAVKNEEAECLENTPENLQSSKQYENTEIAVDCLETAYFHLDDTTPYFDDVISCLEEAIRKE